MANVFLSYRREDSQHITERIADRLVAQFGKGSIFKDVDSITPGADFRRALHEAIGQCKVVLAVIGPRWLGITDASGRRRLEDENDFVRKEIEGGLARGIPVIPVLVDRATMPAAADLPSSLQALAFCQAVAVRPDPDFHRDMDRLLEAVQQHRSAGTDGPGPVPETRPLRILLAEDYAVNQRLAVRVLEDQGHAVTAVATGKELLAAVEAGGLDLILMQMQMADLDAFTATSDLRRMQREKGYSAAIVGMTNDAESRQRCMQAGMDAFVSRPVRAGELLEVIRRLTEVVDWQQALRGVGDDQELLKELINLFLADCPGLMAEIGGAITRKDAAHLRRRAHTLKGSFSTLGARTAMEVALRLETMGRSGDLTGVEEVWTALEREVERFRAALTAYLRGA
jgi:CheY-like chemotaxis protein